MATDPVRQVRELEHETAIALDMRESLRRLAQLPPSQTVPYLTVCLDWRPEGSEPGRLPPEPGKRSERRSEAGESGPPRRPSWQQMRRELDELVGRYGPRGDAFDSLSADVARIERYLAEELDVGAKGVVIVACQGQGICAPCPLDVAVASECALGPSPHLRPQVHP